MFTEDISKIINQTPSIRPKIRWNRNPEETTNKWSFYGQIPEKCVKVLVNHKKQSIYSELKVCIHFNDISTGIIPIQEIEIQSLSGDWLPLQTYLNKVFGNNL